MCNKSIQEQLKAVKNEAASDEFPLVRRDGTFRAKVLAHTEAGNPLVKFWDTITNRTAIRETTDEYMENNYWGGTN